MSSTDEALFNDFLAGSRSESEATLDAASQIEAGDAELSAPVGIGKTFQRGFRAGVAGLDTDAQYFGALANTLMGDEEAAKERVKRARLAETEASNALAGINTFEEFLEQPTVGGFLDQAILSVGQITPMAATAIGTSLTGALVGASTRLGANAVRKGITKKLVNDTLKKKLRKEPLDADEKALLDIGYGLTQSAKTGALGGAFLQEYPMMAGGSFGEFDEAGVDLTGERALQAAALGVPLAAVGVAGEALIVKSLANLATKKAKKTGTSRLKEYASNILKEGAFGGATEAGTEIVQEGAMVAQRMAVDPEYDAAQAQLRLGQAAFAGFFGGKALSGTGAAVAGIPQVLRDTTARAKEFIDNSYEANVASEIDDEIELAAIEQQFEFDFGDPPEAPPAPDAPTPDAPTPDAPTPDAPTPDAPTPDAPTPGAPTPDAPTTPDTGPREMQLADELTAFLDASPEQDPRNIDADDTGELPFDPEGPFSDINPQEDRGREPRTVKSYKVQEARFRQQSLDDPEYNQRFNLLNQLYERRGYTEDDGTSVLEKFRGVLSPSNLKVLAELIVKNSDTATYFPEFQTVDGEQRVAVIEYPTEQGRRRARRQTIDPETGQEIEANAAELSASAITTAQRGAGNPDLPKFRVVNQIVENREVTDPETGDQQTQRVVVGHSAFGDLEGAANNQNVELGFLANAGISVNTADQATVMGEGLSRAQQLKLGLLRMFGELVGSEKALSFEGQVLDVQALAAEASINVDADGRYNGTNPVLQAEVNSEGYSDSLGNLLLTPDPRTNRDRTAAINQQKRVDEALAQNNRDIADITEKYRNEFRVERDRMRAQGRTQADINRMGANLKSRMATEVAAFTELDPADITKEQDLDPITNPEDRAEQEFRQEGGLDQEDADLYSPAREEDPNKAVKTEQINKRFNARANRIREKFNQALDPVIKVISGGQDGVDVSFLNIASGLGIATGGTAPQGFRTQSGNKPELAQQFGLEESKSRNYTDRTRQNVKDSDGTVIVVRDPENLTPGSKATIRFARQLDKPFLVVTPETDPRTVKEWISNNKIKTLNGAGSRDISGDRLNTFITEVLRPDTVDAPAPSAEIDASARKQLALNELNRRAELEKLEAQPAERIKARPSRILLESQPMPGDRMAGAPLRAADARVLGNAALTPVAELGPNRRAARRQLGRPDRKYKRVKRKTSPTVTLNGNLGTLTSRIANKAMDLFKFSKPVHIFTLSDLKSNWEFYVGGNTALATGIVNTNEYVSGPIFERTNALMEAEGLSRQDAQARVLREVDALPEAERVTTFRNSKLGVKISQTKAKQEVGKGLYAPLGEFLSETITRMDETQDGVRVPGRMITTGDAHIIVINDTDVQSGTLSDAALGTVLAHEVGHILFKEEMQSLLDKPRGKLLFEAFQRHVEEMGGETPSQYADADELMSLGFEEFYADQVAVFLLDESAKADTGAKAYFKQVAKKLKEFMKAVSRILGGRIAQATTTNAQVGVPFRAKQEGETDAAYNEAKTAYDNQPFVKTYFDQVVAEHKRKTRELVDEYDEVGWAAQHAAREIAIDVQKEIKDRAPGLLNSYKTVVEKILQSGSYKWLSRMLSSVDGWLREQGPEGVAIAQFFYAKSSSLEGVGFHEAKGRKNREFNNRLAAIFGLNIKAEENSWEVPEVKDSLELAQNENVSDADLQRRADAGDVIAANALEVRGLFSDIFDNYITNPETGRPWFAIQKRTNYAPRMWNFIAIQENPDAFRTLLLESGLSPKRIDALLKYIDENETSEDIRLGETEEDARLRRELEELNYQAERLAERRGITVQRANEIIRLAKEKARLSPGMDAALSRELGRVSTAAAREAGFMQPAGMAMIQYFHQLTRKVEYERRGGYARLKSLIDAAPEDIREHLDDAILAQLGKKGQGMTGGWRLFNSIAAVHTALTTLLFTVFASVTDLAGIGVRLKEYDNIRAFYKEVFSGFKESFTGTGERVQFAMDVGVITMEAMDNMFIAVGELDFANTWARKTMAGFFKYTGLNWYTRATRIMAAGAGRMFIIRTATKKDFGAREARYLEELGLTRDEVLAAYDEKNDHLDIKSNEKIREAVVRFAEESIIRPNPAQRPSWASSPYFTAIWQLKSYFYAYGKTVLGGMGREVKNRYSEDGNFQGGAMLLLMAAGMMLPLTALGLELREYTKWTIQAILPGIDASKRVFRSDYMDTGEYLFEVGIDRSGILGPFTLALTAIESLKWEGPIGPVIANIPFADAIDDVFIDGDYMRTVPVLNNVQ